MLDLYVWGPAFGLPSIDAECLATLTYLRHALPSSAWRLVPCSDPSVSPSNLLPALCHENAWVSGYGPIVEHVASSSLGRDLDEHLDAVQKADTVACRAFLLAHAAPLVDLSLYVSAANWSAVTRPAYSSLLPFPLTWTLPPLIRAEAVKRAEHLGLADLDTDFDPNGGLHLSAGGDALPETFRRHLPATAKKSSVREEMTPEQAAAIRLFSLADDCLSVLNALLSQGQRDGRDGSKRPPRFFDGASPSSLDCLAYGFLALMLVPPVPRSFLRDWIDAEAPRLAAFVDSMAPADLPCRPATATTVLGSTTRIADSILRNIPRLGEHYTNEMRLRKEAGLTGLDQRCLMIVTGVAIAGAAVGYGLQLYRRLQPFGLRTQIWTQSRGGSKLSEFGELGLILNSAMVGYQAERVVAPSDNGSASGRLVELDSELD